MSLLESRRASRVGFIECPCKPLAYLSRIELCGTEGAWLLLPAPGSQGSDPCPVTEGSWARKDCTGQR